MKKILYILAVVLLAACAKEQVSCDFKLSVISGDARYEDGTICLGGDAANAVLSILPEIPTATWSASTPSDDVWFNSFTDKQGAFNICASANETDDPRLSYLYVRIGKKETRVPVVQDYLKTLEFSLAENDIDASEGKIKLPFRSNLDESEMVLSVEEGCSWIVPDIISGGKAFFNVQSNPSTTSTREAEVYITLGSQKATTKVVQAAMSGTAYIVPVKDLDFGKYPVYEIFDGEEKIGEICREYLYRYSSGKTLVDDVCTVAYPVADGQVNYTRGLVLDHGGEVSWNETGIASYEVANGAAGDNIYLARGAKGFRTAPLTAGESPVTATCTPMTVVDSRSGAADSKGGTSESYTYTVAKIGLQYWMRENLKTTRYRDGAPVPTGFEKEAWAANVTPTLYPMCLVSGTSSSNTWVDANDPSGASDRNTYGCLYTYAAVVEQSIDMSQAKAAVFEKVDNISPEGWMVPYLSDFRQLQEYLCQKEYASQSEMTADVLPKLLKSGNNKTGFSAIGSRQRGATGGYNAVLYYMTMDYIYEGGTHSVYHFRLRDGDYALICNVTTSSGTYLRLIKK